MLFASLLLVTVFALILMNESKIIGRKPKSDPEKWQRNISKISPKQVSFHMLFLLQKVHYRSP